MNVFIAGASGMVALRVIDFLPKKWNLYTPGHSELNITDKNALDTYFADKDLDAIINFAAVTDVDGAEKEREDENGVCWQVNVNGTVNLATLAKKKKALMIQISTDAVFDGQKGPYTESDKPADSLEDVGWYGWTKRMAEKKLAEIGTDLTIVRIIFPTGNFANPKDYLNKIKGGLEKGYGMFTDQASSPTYIPDLAKALTTIVEKKKTGIYHVATHPVTTTYEIACAIAQKFDLGEVKKGLLSEYLKNEGIAKRPIKGGLLCDETQKELGLTFASLNEVLATF